jgi:prepilin-type N-terminal cleavage/methylation domain-containing protein
MKHLRQKLTKTSGFTIIEVVIVLAIVGLMTVIVFIAVPAAQVSARDNHRKAYARSVLEALEEFNKNNGRFPGCNTGCSTVDMQRFMMNYMPDGSDPTTGKSYHPASVLSTHDGHYGGGSVVKSTNSSSASVYIDNGVYHYLIPKVGQVIIATAHWCYGTQGKDPGASGTDHGPPIAGSKQDPVTGLWDQDFTKFVVLVYQEHGSYYCLDDFANSGKATEN